MPAQPLGCLAAHRVGDGGALVAALGDVAGVAEATHQLRPGARDAAGVPADLGRLGGQAVAGQRGQHQVERVLGVPAVRGRVGERADYPEQLDHRPGPAVRDDQRQRFRVPRLHVDEVDVLAVDLGLELGQRVQPRLARAPVVIGRPIAGELLDHRQLHALRPVGDELLGGPAGSRDTRTQRLKFRLGNLRDGVRPDRCRARRVPDRGRHADLLGWFDGRYGAGSSSRSRGIPGGVSGAPPWTRAAPLLGRCGRDRGFPSSRCRIQIPTAGFRVRRPGCRSYAGARRRGGEHLGFDGHGSSFRERQPCPAHGTVVLVSG